MADEVTAVGLSTCGGNSRKLNAKAAKGVVVKPFYLLILFYASVRENTPLITDAVRTVNALSKGQYCRLGYGEHMCAIGFRSSQPYAAIRADLQPIRGDKLHSLIVEASHVVGGSMYEEAWKWLAPHMQPAEK